MKFSKDILDLAKKEIELKDQIWVLITNSNDKSKAITIKHLEKLNEILNFKLSSQEINSILFWGKYGYSNNFKVIQNQWLDLQTNNNNKNNDSIQFSPSYKESLLIKGNDNNNDLKHIEINYQEFSLIFDKSRINNKRRLIERININNIK